MLRQLLTKDHIICLPSAADWESAVRLATRPLLSSGAVSEAYVDAMVRSVRENGAYIVVDDGLALPHARPEDGAAALGLSMLILQKPVDMLGESVSVLVALSAVDDASHIDAMRDLAELVWNGCNAKTLAAAKSPEEAAALINRYAGEGL